MCISCCCANKPPQKYIGSWSDGDTARLRIWPSGRIDYRREFDGGGEKWLVSARYDEEGFWTCVLGCCTLKGKYLEQTRRGPAFLVKNQILTKQPAPKPIFTTTV